MDSNFLRHINQMTKINRQMTAYSSMTELVNKSVDKMIPKNAVDYINQITKAQEAAVPRTMIEAIAKMPKVPQLPRGVASIITGFNQDSALGRAIKAADSMGALLKPMTIATNSLRLPMLGSNWLTQSSLFDSYVNNKIAHPIFYSNAVFSMTREFDRLSVLLPEMDEDGENIEEVVMMIGHSLQVAFDEAIVGIQEDVSDEVEVIRGLIAKILVAAAQGKEKLFQVVGQAHDRSNEMLLKNFYLGMFVSGLFGTLLGVAYQKLTTETETVKRVEVIHKTTTKSFAVNSKPIDIKSRARIDSKTVLRLPAGSESEVLRSAKKWAFIRARAEDNSVYEGYVLLSALDE